MAVQDHSYKLLFSHARMVRDLLQGFVGGDWLATIDFSTLERVSDAYVTDDLRARADDIIWRVRCDERDVYLLIEFQSCPEPFMAVRVLTYVGLLYQDLIKAQKVRRDELLPSVLPLVLYNGMQRWRAARDLGTLLYEAPRGLENLRPALPYLLIDEGAYDDAQLALDGNLVAMLFRLENCFQRQMAKDLVTALVSQLRDPALQSLRRAFAIWLDRVVFTRFTGTAADSTNELWERAAMLADRVPIWEQELRQEGQARLLLHIMDKRFGTLPERVKDRLTGGTSEQLTRWAERLLEGSSLTELFDAEVAS